MEVVEWEGDYTIDQWDVEDGLPGIQVLFLAGSSDGFIWVVTLFG